jgi:hypothetical protein
MRRQAQQRQKPEIIAIDEEEVEPMDDDLDETERRALQQAIQQSKKEEQIKQQKKQEELQREMQRKAQEAIQQPSYYSDTGAPRVELVEDDEELEHALRESMKMEEQRLQEEENKHNRMLREEQDRAFHESLLQDQERERAQQEEIRKQELEELQKEDEEAMKLSIELNRRKRCQDLADQLPPEPSIQSRNVTHIVIRMPTGDRLERRFLTTDKLQLLKDFVESKAFDYQLPPQYEIVNTFPKQTFSDLSITLGEAGLVGRSLVAVQPV